MTYSIDAALMMEDQQWEAAESGLHEEINRLGKEHRAEIEAVEAKERLEKFERKKARIRKENRDLFLCRISLDVMFATVFVSWGVAGFISIPFAIVGILLAVVTSIREVRGYIDFVRRWS